MDSNLSLNRKILCRSIMLSLMFICFMLGTFKARAESEAAEAYRRQVKFETDRASDFRRFLKYLESIDRERNSAVPSYKTAKEKIDKEFEEARRDYAEWRKREDAKKPSDEYIERMLASELEKEAREKEAIRKEFVKVQQEIERAIANTRLDEAEEYQLDR